MGIDKWKQIDADYAIINASKGVTVKDKDFDKAARSLVKENVTFAIYHTATGKCSGAREAKWFIECCGEYALYDKSVLVLNWDDSLVSKVEYAKEFLDTVKEFTDKKPAIWMSFNAIECGEMDALSSEYPLFLVVDGEAEAEKKEAEEQRVEVVPIIIKETESPVYCKVKSRDTLLKLAMQYDTTVKAIKDLNPDIQKTSKIYPGQRIRVK